MILTLLALAAAAVQAAPPTPEEEARFRACSTLARSAPDQAVDTANRWLAERGGLLARQCLGLAYVSLERWAPAATVYEQAARDAERAQDARRADFWVQAGNGWLAAEEPVRAVQAFDAALATTNLTSELRGEVHLDRARALVSLNNLPAARTDLDRAVALVPSDPMVWYLSAALARRENNLQRAQTDISRATQLAPNDPEVLLLAGTIAGAAGNRAEAERLYRSVVAAAPQSEAGRAAAASLGTGEAEAPAAPAQPQLPGRPQPQSR